MILREAIATAEAKLCKAGIEAARLEAQVLAAEVLGEDRSYVLAHLDDGFDQAAFARIVEQRSKGEPLAYVLGWREFYSRRYEVNPSVLVPRHETETLVELALDWIRDRASAVVADVGTGSGCIGISLALECGTCSVIGSDISADALDVAKANARALGAEIGLVRSDLVDAFRASSIDLIVCNPPYVATSDELPAEIEQHEPHGALFGGTDGLDVYRRLASECDRVVRSGGAIAVELGDRRAEAVASLFGECGWRLMRTAADLQGIDRASVFERR
ncbi:MAG: peptide chain release factor N(5)-glutamine methyltransferase [Armatimonadetes bacterium]|nr:peptide chain release factor N(5)-glutamine methyltransferase [Armatimonadota bacterium]